MENTKLPYYIFLDIDGTLWDLVFGNHVHGPYLPYQPEPRLKPESVSALNLLLSSLEDKFDTSLVITSGRRGNLAKCTEYLHRDGLEYNKPIYCTKFVSEGSRGSKIVDYLQQENHGPFIYPTLNSVAQKLLFGLKNSDYSNYVVLEDERKKISKEIPSARCIITNKKHRSLTTAQVERYLSQNGIAFEKTEEKLF